MSSVTINPGDGPDIAALINAALADPAVTTVILGEGVFMLGSPIFVPSGKTLDGAGRDLTILRAAEGFDRVAPGEGDGVVNSELGAVDITLTDFSIDANKLTPEGTRMVGCFMKEATFTIARVDVYNATAYGHFAQGDTVNYARPASGTYDDCAVYNSQIAFEQMAADGITLTDCVAGDGDGDLAGTYFHPLTGSKNITYVNCTASGYANVGFELTGNVRALENIRIVDCSVEMLGDGAAFVAAGEFQTLNLEFDGSSFISHGNSAALIYGSVGTAVDSYFQGEAIGIAFFHSPHLTPSEFTLTDSHVVGINDPTVAAAFGVSSSGGTIVWDGGSIEARGAAVIPISGPLTVTPGTSIVADGYDAITVYAENGEPLAIGPSLLLDGLPPGSLDGGSLRVALEAKGMTADRLAILDQGSGPGQIGMDGSDVTFGGTSIGTWSGGANGSDLLIDLNSGATAAALAALVKAIGFASASDTPEPYRAIELVVTDADGISTETNIAIAFIRINDAPAVSGAALGSDATLVYSEGAGAAAIAPAASLTDVDSANFAGGSLTVRFVENGDSDDRLTIVSEGIGPGQIDVLGNVVSYSGVAIGTFSGGEDGATPIVISLNAAATLDAVQALMRAVAYSNVSLAPNVTWRSVEFMLDDGDGGLSPGTANALILFEGVEYDPIAKDDEVAADAGLGILAASVFADNGHGVDWDPDGPGLEIVAVNGIAADVGEEVLLASGAGLTLRADGSWDYDPNGMFDGLAAAGTGAVNSFATDSFTYTLAGGETATVTVTIHGAHNPGDRLEGNGADNVITGTAFGDLIFLEQGGDDDVDGGEGDDRVHYGAAWSAADRTAGGSGTDTVILGGSYTLVLGAESLVGIEQLLLESGSLLPDGAPNLYAITTADENVAAGAGLQILAGALQADEGLLLDASAETDGSFEVESGLGDDAIALGGGADLVHSGGGNDRIDGGSGADAMHGGLGDDLYIVDDSGDTVIENDGEGDDEISTGLAAYGLAGFVERLTGTSALGQALTGNALANRIDGAAGSDFIAGGLGADSMAGGVGNDIYVVDESGDSVVENDGEGDDEIRTGLAAYSLDGLDFVEKLTGTSALGQALTGNGFANAIAGAAGDDLIDGGLGADSMAGDGGNDIYLVEDSADTIVELDGEGIDEVRTSLGSKSAPGYELYVLPDFVENLTGTSADAQGVRGNALDNVIAMGAGADLVVLDDGGADRVDSGGGNDFIYYGSALTAEDVTDGGAGIDTLGLLGSYAIAFTAGSLVGIERLALYTGGGANSYDISMDDSNVAAGAEFFVTAASLGAGESLIFNGLAESDGRFVVHGGAGGDTIVSGAGDDFLIGNSGEDMLYGLAGSDYLIGGLGSDRLRGGNGTDFFRYQDWAESTSAATDRILDFEHDDRIDLAAVDANSLLAGNQAFTFIGGAAFNGTAGQLRAYESGGLWFVEGDVNGDKAADLVIEVALIAAPPLTGADFIF